MIRRLSQQHAVVQWKIFKEKIEWAIIANLKILLVKCKQTNYQFGIQVRYQKMVWSFYHFSSLNVQPVDFNLIFFYQNTSEKVCSCVYSIDRQGRSWCQNILREAVHPRTYNALVMTVQHKFLRDPLNYYRARGADKLRVSKNFASASWPRLNCILSLWNKVARKSTLKGSVGMFVTVNEFSKMFTVLF